MIKTILPALITIIGNLIFYILIKGKIDKSIEKNKIAYGGIFKEKLFVYRELLKKTYQLKKMLNQFQYSGTKEDGTEIMQVVNDYIQFYLVNQPFLSIQMLEDLNKLREEFQDVFDKIYRHIANTDAEFVKEYFEATNKLKSNNPFNQIEDRIISEMRNDLRVYNFE